MKWRMIWCQGFYYFFRPAWGSTFERDQNKITRWNSLRSRDFSFITILFKSYTCAVFPLFSNAYWWDNVTCTSSPVHLSFWRVVQSRTHSLGRDVSPPQTLFMCVCMCGEVLLLFARFCCWCYTTFSKNIYMFIVAFWVERKEESKNEPLVSPLG